MPVSRSRNSRPGTLAPGLAPLSRSRSRDFFRRGRMRVARCRPRRSGPDIVGMSGRERGRHNSHQLFCRPDAVPLVPGEKNILLEGQWPLERVLRGEPQPPHLEWKLGGALHISEADRPGELDARGPKRFFGHLDTVERTIVFRKLVVERHLFLEDLVAKFHDLRDLLCYIPDASA